MDDHEWFEWFFNKTEAERMKMANDEKVWKESVEDYKGKYDALLKIQEMAR